MLSYFRPNVNVKRAMIRILLRSIILQARCSRGALGDAAACHMRGGADRPRRADADFVGGAQPLPAVPRGARFPAPRRERAQAAAFSPPSRRWSCRATAAAGRATRSTGSASTSPGRVSEPCTRDNVKESYLTPIDHPVTVRLTGAGSGRRHLRLVVRRRRRRRRQSTFDCAEPINLRVRYGRHHGRHRRCLQRLRRAAARLDRDRGARHLHRRPWRQHRLRRRQSGPRRSRCPTKAFASAPISARRRRNITGRAAPATRAAAPARRRTRCRTGSATSALWFNSACHRSLYSYQTRTALALAVQYPHIAVTYLPLACTGATIADGLFGSQRARECPPTKSGTTCQGTRQRASSPNCARRSPPRSAASPTASSIWCCCRSAPTTSISPASSPTSSSTPRPSARCSGAPA